MKRTEVRRKLADFLITAEAERAAQLDQAAESWDDSVSEDIFDVEDDDAEVAFIVQNLKRRLH